jgi:hypothetical protein
MMDEVSHRRLARAAAEAPPATPPMIRSRPVFVMLVLSS